MAAITRFCARGLLAVSTIVAALSIVTGDSFAAEFSAEGYGDVRLIAPPDTRGYLDGGLGKLRFGDDDGGIRPGDIVGEGRVTGDAWSAQIDARLSPTYGAALDITQAFVRYAPPTQTQWSWSARAGAFFIPISLENEDVAWSSFWTITPSAINSWIGAELRTVGAEGTLQWSSNGNVVTLIGALFGFNDPAGVALADRGWNFDDRITGLFERYRLPDALAIASGRTPPVTTHLFREIDNTPGWYLDLSYEIDGKTGFELMHYDNQADPRRPRSWHTTFWDVGFRRQLGPVTILAQAMIGDTIIRPTAATFTDTDFKSAYVLAGWDLDDWWLAARADVFETRTRNALGASPLSEDGHAFDATASWRATRHIRLSAEYLYVDSRRPQRAVTADPPQQIEQQFQLVARVHF